MCAEALRAAGLRVTAVVGGDVPAFPMGAGALLPPAAPASRSQAYEDELLPIESGGAQQARGGGAWLVIEADEYDGAFLGLRPQVLVSAGAERAGRAGAPCEELA